MNASEQIQDANIRHQVYLQRYSEAGFMGDRVPERVTPLVEPFIRREDIERAPLLDVYDDMNLRLLLLLGV